VLRRVEKKKKKKKEERESKKLFNDTLILRESRCMRAMRTKRRFLYHL
jgi:hypothetical protein